MKKLQNQKGFTMVEIIVAAVIISLCALMLLATFGASTNILQRTHNRDYASNNAFAAVESLDGATVETVQADAVIRFTVNGVEYVVQGDYLSATVMEEDASVTYKIFEKKPAGGTP